MSAEVRERLYTVLLYLRLVAFFAFWGEMLYTFARGPLMSSIYVVTLLVSAASIAGRFYLDRYRTF